MDIVGKRKLYFTFSIILIIGAIAAMGFNGLVRGSVLNFGIDFTGGSLVTLRIESDFTVEDVRSQLKQFGLSKSTIQRTSKTDISIRSEEIDVSLRVKIVEALQAKYGSVELLEADTIGPVIGKELRRQAIWALVIASLLILIYVSFRFELKYAIAALLALYHDAIITTGVIAFLWHTVDTPFIAAILTIMGYSINDTIVIFDRIRENLKKPENAKKNYVQILNESIWQTMSRSINTVLTVLFVVVALLIFGGATLQDFAFVLLIGFICGTYSSIFVAAPLLLLWRDLTK